MINVITLQIQTNWNFDASDVDWNKLLKDYNIQNVNTYDHYIIRTTIPPEHIKDEKTC